MISRRTIVVLLLASLLGLGLRVWAMDRRDDCDRYGPGTRAQPTSMKVISGTRSVDVPCARWTWGLRQSTGVQGLLLVEFVLGVMVVVSAGADWARRRDGGR